MHRLFTSVYLVHEICSHVSRSKLPILALVSSIWFRCAISCLYSRNLELDQALKPLGYIIHKDGEATESANCSYDEDFQRMLKYTLYIRDLTVSSLPKPITLEAYRRNVSGRIRYLFPNIRTLRLNWVPDYSPDHIMISASLISQKINQLSIKIADPRVLRYLCPLATAQVSALSLIHLQEGTRTGTTGNSTRSPITNPVHQLLIAFTDTLTSVCIPLSFSTPSIIECLSKMPNLFNLDVGKHLTLTKELKRSGVPRDRRSFSSLRLLSFDGSIQSFYGMFLDPYDLVSLMVLSLNTKFAFADVERIIPSLSVACPHLEELRIGEQGPVAPRTTFPPVVP